MKIKHRQPMTGAHWNLSYLEVSQQEGRDFLNDDQYENVVDQFEVLAQEHDPTHSTTADIEPIDEFYELRDKGGILGKINLRVYFAVWPRFKTLVVLGAIKKEAEGQCPPHVVIRMRHRKRNVERNLKCPR